VSAHPIVRIEQNDNYPVPFRAPSP
jgi:hypothetical protein